MRQATLRLIIAATALGVAAAPVAAQNLADLIPTLFGTRIVLAPPPPGFPSHEAHFLDDSLALAGTGRTLDQSLIEQLSSVPLVSAAGSFTYTLDPTLGTFTRSTESFGPLFTDRAQTIGRGKLNVGFNYLQASYDKLDDLELDNGDVQFQLRHLDTPPTDPDVEDVPQPFFEGDVIGVRTFLDVKNQTTSFYANYGVTDRFDVSAVVPVVKVDINAHADLKINRLSTGGSPSTAAIHQFVGGGDSATFAASDSATGIGDVLLRGKLRFGSWFASAVDVRLPTGKEEDLLGTGFTQYKLSFIGSGNFGRAGLHGNLGYSVASGSSSVLSDLPDELSYGAALDVAVHPRFTIVGEVFGRTLYDATSAVSTEVTHIYQDGPGGPTRQAQLPQVTFRKADLQLLQGSFGIKVNPTGNLLFSADALVPLSNDGLQAKGVVAVFGAEYSF